MDRLEDALSKIGKSLKVASSSGEFEDDLERLELSKRSYKSHYNVLIRAGISSISKLIETTRAELLALERFGPTTVDEIEEKLKNLGKSLKNENDL